MVKIHYLSPTQGSIPPSLSVLPEEEIEVSAAASARAAADLEGPEEALRGDEAESSSEEVEEEDELNGAEEGPKAKSGREKLGLCKERQAKSPPCPHSIEA